MLGEAEVDTQQHALQQNEHMNDVVILKPELRLYCAVLFTTAAQQIDNTVVDQCMQRLIFCLTCSASSSLHPSSGVLYVRWHVSEAELTDGCVRA